MCFTPQSSMCGCLKLSVRVKVKLEVQKVEEGGNHIFFLLLMLLTLNRLFHLELSWCLRFSWKLKKTLDCISDDKIFLPSTCFFVLVQNILAQDLHSSLYEIMAFK